MDAVLEAALKPLRDGLLEAREEATAFRGEAAREIDALKERVRVLEARPEVSAPAPRRRKATAAVFSAAPAAPSAAVPAPRKRKAAAVPPAVAAAEPSVAPAAAAEPPAASAAPAAAAPAADTDAEEDCECGRHLEAEDYRGTCDKCGDRICDECRNGTYFIDRGDFPDLTLCETCYDNLDDERAKEPNYCLRVLLWPEAEYHDYEDSDGYEVNYDRDTIISVLRWAIHGKTPTEIAKLETWKDNDEVACVIYDFYVNVLIREGDEDEQKKYAYKHENLLSEHSEARKGRLEDNEDDGEED